MGKDVDVFFASAFLGPTIAGAYSVAKRVLLAANLILVNAISAVTLPAFANLGAEDERRRAFLNTCAGVVMADAERSISVSKTLW